MANALNLAILQMITVATVAGVAATPREYGIGVRITEQGFHVLLQEPLRRLLGKAANADDATKNITVKIPADKQLKATIDMKAGGSVVLTTGFGRDADGVLQFADFKCEESGDLQAQLKGICQKVTGYISGINEDLKNMSKRMHLERTDGSRVAFDVSLLKDPQIAKPATGESFAKFILSGRWSQNATKANVKADSPGLEMNDVFMKDDIVFEVTDVFLDSLIQSFNESGLLKNVDLNPTQAREVMEKYNKTLGAYAENFTEAAVDMASMFRTTCESEFGKPAESCIGSLLGKQFQALFPNDVVILDVDISPEPITVKENHVSSSVAGFARLKGAFSRKHMFDLEASIEVALENASIVNGTAYLHAAEPPLPTFHVVNDDANGTVTDERVGTIWDMAQNTITEKLQVWGRDGVSIPKLPFINVIDAKMETHEGRIYFVVSKAEIAAD